MFDNIPDNCDREAIKELFFFLTNNTETTKLDQECRQMAVWVNDALAKGNDIYHSKQAYNYDSCIGMRVDRASEKYDQLFGFSLEKCDRKVLSSICQQWYLDGTNTSLQKLIDQGIV